MDVVVNVLSLDFFFLFFESAIIHISYPVLSFFFFFFSFFYQLVRLSYSIPMQSHSVILLILWAMKFQPDQCHLQYSSVQFRTSRLFQAN